MIESRSTLFHLAILAAGALFGFYSTMSVSIMPGFDLSDPYAALQSNQDIGKASKQSAFFIALLGTPVLLIATIVVTWSNTLSRTWLFVALSGWVAMMLVTLLGNVPLNQLLDGMTITVDSGGLAEAWLAYSKPWQFWNWFRVLFSGMTLWAAVTAFKSH